MVEDSPWLYLKVLNKIRVAVFHSVASNQRLKFQIKLSSFCTVETFNVDIEF
jgi:hypothetical protein